MFSGFRLSIRTQLYASSIVTCLMLVVLVGIAALQLRRLSRETTELSSETKFVMTLATSIEKAAAVMALPGQAAEGAAPRSTAIWCAGTTWRTISTPWPRSAATRRKRA
jgi:hypothetical protein